MGAALVTLCGLLILVASLIVEHVLYGWWTLTFDNIDVFVFDKAHKVKILKYLLSKSLELFALWSTFRDMCLLCF